MLNIVAFNSTLKFISYTISNFIMQKTFLIVLIFINTSISGLYASDNEFHAKGTHHTHHCESDELMFAYQYGYTEIRSKNNHMSDDSGTFIGIHIMKRIENAKFNNNFYLASGAHTTFTKDKHVGLMLGIMYPMNETTMISIMPGLIFMKHVTDHSNMGMAMDMGHSIDTNNTWETEEAIHLEISHTITLFSRILNPSISWMSSSSHNQYSLGLNFHF